MGPVHPAGKGVLEAIIDLDATSTDSDATATGLDAASTDLDATSTDLIVAPCGNPYLDLIIGR
jgi:hypothetical protein